MTNKTVKMKNPRRDLEDGAKVEWAENHYKLIEDPKRKGEEARVKIMKVSAEIFDQLLYLISKL